MDLQRRFSRVFGSEGPFAGNRRSWLCATVSRAVTANKLSHNDLHTNPRSESGSPDNVRGKEVFYKCLIPCKVITLHT